VFLDLGLKATSRSAHSPRIAVLRSIGRTLRTRVRIQKRGRATIARRLRVDGVRSRESCSEMALSDAVDAIDRCGRRLESQREARYEIRPRRRSLPRLSRPRLPGYFNAASGSARAPLPRSSPLDSRANRDSTPDLPSQPSFALPRANDRARLYGTAFERVKAQSCEYPSRQFATR
jgi:hypothetical protein